MIKETRNIRATIRRDRIGTMTTGSWSRVVGATLLLTASTVSTGCSCGSTHGEVPASVSTVSPTTPPSAQDRPNPNGEPTDSKGSAAVPEQGAGSDLVSAVCDRTAVVESRGTISDSRITEASGLAASRSTPGVWWTHNDSGGKPELYAVDNSGRMLAVLHLEGSRAIDWEDIAVAVDRHGVESIYVADIGDGRRGRDHITIYRGAAPDLSIAANGTNPVRLSARADTFEFVYPDGPRDAEALIVDPTDGSIYIIDKDWSLRGNSNVYRGRPDSSSTASPVTLEKVRQLNFPPATLVTAADVSPDRTALAVRAYGIEYLYGLGPGEALTDALGREPCTGPKVAEAQGEAIAFSADSRSYATVAEGPNPTIHAVIVPE